MNRCTRINDNLIKGSAKSVACCHTVINRQDVFTRRIVTIYRNKLKAVIIGISLGFRSAVAVYYKVIFISVSSVAKRLFTD